MILYSIVTQWGKGRREEGRREGEKGKWIGKGKEGGNEREKAKERGEGK